MFSFHAECMGTVFLFQIEDELSEFELNRLCDTAMEIIADADEKFSLYKSDSELSKLNRGEIDWGHASNQQHLIKAQSDYWQVQTSGYFNANSADGYDPAGIVKTWAAQNAVNFLQANGVARFTLNAGGDVYLSGGFNDLLLGRVGISKLVSIAAQGAGAALIVDLNDTDFKAICTSGSVERGSHIWGESAEFVQATVIGADLVEADVWATALIAGGEKAFALLEKTQNHLQAIVFRQDETSLATEGLSDLVVAE